MKKVTRIIFLGLLFLMLINVRVFVQPYLYDPLTSYFKNEYLYAPIPKVNLFNFFLNLFYRYTLNTIISLMILYLIFNNLKDLKFSIIFYSVAFVALGSILFVLLEYNLNQGYMLVFHVRRFLIHPIFLLLLIPTFYYQKLQLKRNNLK